MAEHTIGYGKKVITDSSGTLYSSGGPDGPYNANEEEFFIIRRTAAEYTAKNYFILSFNSWNVADYSIATSSYDYIDVYKQTGSGYDPSDWQWIERIGGIDLSSSAVITTNTYYLNARNIKLVFRSNYRQNYSYYGFKLNFSTSSSYSTFTDLDSIASTTYTDQINIKENAGDTQRLVLDNVAKDPAKTNWDFIPPKQFDSDDGGNVINILNYQFVNFNYSMTSGKIPLSFTQPERSTARFNSQNVSNISRKRN